MYALSSLWPSGAGLSFFRFSIALIAIALGFAAAPPPAPPSALRAGRSNRTTGTRALTQCAAICAPITPAPSTATLRTLKFFIQYLPGLFFLNSEHARRHGPERARQNCSAASAIRLPAPERAARM